MNIIIQNRFAILLLDEIESSKMPYFKRWFPTNKREHKEPIILIRV